MAQITKNDFSKLMLEICSTDRGIARKKRLAVACSGGPDSMTLCLLTKDWAAENGYQLVVLIVDHRLRENATSEAGLVKKRLVGAGLDAHILTRLSDDKITRDIQNQARIVRYQLLETYCVAHDIPAILTAHHQEDQAETFLLRLARGSGVDGLAAMRPNSRLGAVRLLRPLLDVPKADILSTLASFEIPALDDPSNVNEAFDRVKMRNRQALFDDVGLTAKRLACTAKNLSRARIALEYMSDDLLTKAVTFFPEGYCRLLTEPIKDAPEEIALRVVSRILVAIGGRKYPPRLSQVERLYQRLLLNNLQGGCTLAGCGVVPKDQVLLFFRENAAITDCQNLSPHLVWDNRYRLSFEDFDADIELRQLGDEGWRQLKKIFDKKCELPAVVRNSLPALWRHNGLLSVPHIQGLNHANGFGLTKICFMSAENFSNGPFY